MKHLLIGAALAVGLVSSAVAQCRQALALGLDVSGSVDLREYRLQLDGLVSALNHPDVKSSLFAIPGAPVSLLVYEWSGPTDQLVLVPWTRIVNEADLATVSATLATTERRQSTPGTALGDAMALGRELVMQQSDCWKLTLDISGDGHSNLGPRPRDMRPALARAGITVNALVIGADSLVGADRRQSDIAELVAYFQSEVIVGADAFVQTALGFDAYADAMRAKLKRELQGAVIGSLQ